MQLQFIRQELGEKLLADMKNAASVRDASNAVLFQYERPSDQSQDVQDKRAEYGERFFAQYGAPVYFRVRRTWKDNASQLGAFRVYQNAKACADANTGYAVFNESGEQIYPAVEAAATETLSDQEPETEHIAIWVVITPTNDEVVVRNGNGTNFSPIATVASGTKLEYVASAFNGWHAVKIDNQVGWVAGQYGEITTE